LRKRGTKSTYIQQDRKPPRPKGGEISRWLSRTRILREFFLDLQSNDKIRGTRLSAQVREANPPGLFPWSRLVAQHAFQNMSAQSAYLDCSPGKTFKHEERLILYFMAMVVLRVRHWTPVKKETFAH
jgi:hypothetical protein